MVDETKEPSFQETRDISVLFLITGPLIFSILYAAELLFGFPGGIMVGFTSMIGCLACAIIISGNYFYQTNKD